jgi:hypothetical protein
VVAFLCAQKSPSCLIGRAVRTVAMSLPAVRSGK